MYTCFFSGYTITAILRWKPLGFVANVLFCMAVAGFLGLIAACTWNLTKKGSGKGIINLFLILGCGAATFFTFGLLMFACTGSGSRPF
ncbi:MAG: hypothetical protein JXQ71_00890 [Verrucomicrobia bacterium]|nr:hypothetical protein [Verrucomicrobiota bacterium]